ncbi:MAG: methionine adenosyltransferase, partial [Flavobacteriales bacterium]
VRATGSAEDQLELQGAGDQGMMFGYACTDTPDLMPLPIWLAHRLAERLSEVRKSGAVPYLRPDGKTQVTIEYENGRPVRLSHVLVSTQHQDGIDRDTVIRPDLIEHVIRPVVPADFADDDYDVYVNPTGKFVVGGPHGDTGLTGRKIIVDTYGGKGAHGGGAFSGKDPSKVDRSAAYAARHIAKNLVAAGVCDEILVQVAYAIGVAKPVGFYVNTYNTSKVKLTDGEIARKVAAMPEFDMRPYFIVKRFALRTPIYSETAAYGHMGRTPQTVTKTFKNAGQETTVKVKLFPWEELDAVPAVKKAFGMK